MSCREAHHIKINQKEVDEYSFGKYGSLDC